MLPQENSSSKLEAPPVLVDVLEKNITTDSIRLLCRHDFLRHPFIVFSLMLDTPRSKLRSIGDGAVTVSSLCRGHLVLADVVGTDHIDVTCENFAEYGSMKSRRAAGGGALGRSRWQRGPHPSRHGRLPLRSRRPASAAQHTYRDGSATTGGASATTSPIALSNTSTCRLRSSAIDGTSACVAGSFAASASPLNDARTSSVCFEMDSGPSSPMVARNRRLSRKCSAVASLSTPGS